MWYGMGEKCIVKIIEDLQENDISDFHLREGLDLYYREVGSLKRYDYELKYDDFIDLIGRNRFEHYRHNLAENEVDFSLEIANMRYRCNIFIAGGKLGLVMRKIVADVKTIDEMGLPTCFKKVAVMKSGLVIISGPTGSGKSTSMAAIVEEINRNQNKHIVSIEDPIEYSYISKSSLISQREVGVDTQSFNKALVNSLRQDPDVIVIGEIRDEETLKIALRAAETGHLCLATIHTLGAAASIDRILDMFSVKDRDKAANNLSIVLKAVISQNLITTELGRRACFDILFIDKAVSNMIREGKVNQIDNYMLVNRLKDMNSMDDDLIDLVKEGCIKINDLRLNCLDLNYCMKKIGRVGMDVW